MGIWHTDTLYFFLIFPFFFASWNDNDDDVAGGFEYNDDRHQHLSAAQWAILRIPIFRSHSPAKNTSSQQQQQKKNKILLQI